MKTDLHQFKSAAIEQARALLMKATQCDLPVLLQGESGVGKEVWARALHDFSARAALPFVAFNCGAFQEELFLSELFGHEKGSFTGATQQKVGLVERAQGGTLFLDEIGELSLAVQAKLLRFLQQKEFQRLGSTLTRKVDVRIVSATNRNLNNEKERGTFREDVFYRLSTLTVEIPSLRFRKEDIPQLSKSFLNELSSGKEIMIHPLAMRALVNYSWPGNIRELRNILQRTVVTMNGHTLYQEDLPMEIRSIQLNREKDQFPMPPPTLRLHDLEKAHIINSLKFHKGNKAHTARTLGISEKTLHNKLNKYGV